VFLPTATETLFNTPSAIARVIQSTAYDKRLVVDASATVDPNHRPLTFRWVVLNGDADRITIHPLNANGSSTEIVVPWHERHPLPWQPSITTDRVDIGVFANNGAHWSAPAFISLLYPGNEKRRYRTDGQIAEVDYDNPDYRQRYVDPVLIPVRNWRDVYRYDDTDHLIGWERIRHDGTTRFTADGLRVTKTDALGRPVKAEGVSYQTRPGREATTEIVEVPTGDTATYVYAANDDQVGTMVPDRAGDPSGE
jgi:hypothetical protein